MFKNQFLSKFREPICWLKTQSGPDNYSKGRFYLNNTILTHIACDVLSSSHLENEDMETQWNHSPPPKDSSVDVAALAANLDSRALLLGSMLLLPSELLRALHTWAGKGPLCSMGGGGLSFLPFRRQTWTQSHSVVLWKGHRVRCPPQHLVSLALLNLLIKACQQSQRKINGIARKEIKSRN